MGSITIVQSLPKSLSWRHAISTSRCHFYALITRDWRAMSSGMSTAMSFNNAAVTVHSSDIGKKALALTDAAKFIASIETFLFDIDGVVWKGGKLLDRVPETFDFLRSLGKNVLFVTNNSTNSRKQVYQKFEKMGLKVREDEIFSSSFAAAGYLKSSGFPANKKVYIVGEVGIQKELEQVDIQCFGGPDDNEKKIDIEAIENVDYDPDVGAVVVGFDRHVNYYKLVYATLCLRNNPGCLFIATNLDRVSNATTTQEWPAGGCMVGAVKASTNMDPVVVGKPSTFMMDYVANKFGISKAQICMVGDNLHTDILFGQNGGCKTLLVLSGVTKMENLKSPDNFVQPDFYTSQISDLLAAKN